MLAKISTFIEEELQVIQNQIGDTSAPVKPIQPISAAEKEAWLLQKAELLECDEILGHAAEQTLYYKE